MSLIVKVLVLKNENVIDICVDSNDTDICIDVLEKFFKVRQDWGLTRVGSAEFAMLSKEEKLTKLAGASYYTEDQDAAIFWKKWFADYTKNMTLVKQLRCILGYKIVDAFEEAYKGNDYATQALNFGKIQKQLCAEAMEEAEKNKR